MRQWVPVLVCEVCGEQFEKHKETIMSSGITYYACPLMKGELQCGNCEVTNPGLPTCEEQEVRR